MQNLFYRKMTGAPLPLLALWMLALTVFLATPSAFAAPDPDMALPPVAASASIQKIAMILPPDLGRPPLPRPKPHTNDAGQLARTAWDEGLMAYRAGDYEAAFRLFAQTETTTRSNAWAHAGAAFWAARTAEKLGNHASAKGYRAIAARYDRTFYGQLARTQLGVSSRRAWDTPAPTPDAIARLKSTSAGRTALAHIHAGRLSAADQSLHALIRGAGPALRQTILAIAVHHGLPATALKLAPTIENDTDTRFDVAYYPVGGWIAPHDFRVDRALVHAIIRQESSFNPRARSPMGAVGLMQLLPSTAHYMMKVRAGGKTSRRDLTHSTHNLDVGQQYLEHLLDRPQVKGDILNMLIAYNAGPGNLAKWQREMTDVTDPLLFIEVIPSAETRAYVEKVMSAYWIYSDRFGTPNPTLHQIATLPAETGLHRLAWFAGLKLSPVAFNSY